MGYAALGLAYYFGFFPPGSKGHWNRLVDCGSIARDAGERHGDVWLTSKALLVLSNGAAWYGRPGESARYAKYLGELSERTNDQRPRCMGLYAFSTLALANGKGEDGMDFAEDALQVALSPVDRFVATTFKSWALALMGRPDESAELVAQDWIQAIMADVAAFRLIDGTVHGLRLVLKGQLGNGVAEIKETMVEIDRVSYLMGQAFSRIALGDIYLELVRGRSNPSFGFMLANLAFLTTTAPRAKKLARRVFEGLLGIAERVDAPSFEAYALLRLAQIDQLRGPGKEARDQLEKARTIAREVGAEAILGEIERELAEAA